jgi:hypothetical protein
MIININTKSNNSYTAVAIELVNNGLDICAKLVNGTYVWIQSDQVREIVLGPRM